jgi:hypothetical protein
MQEVETADAAKCPKIESCKKSIGDAFKITLQAGIWILKTPFALVIIGTGLLFDSTVRMVITLNSQYYRLIHLPEASFGLIGSGLAVLGLFIPRFARNLAEKRSPTFNMGIMTVLSVLGLAGMSFFLPIFGLLPVVLLFTVMFLLNFFLSHYLNRITSSGQRATVLSFKGLSLNLAYGLIGVLYSLLLAFLRWRVGGSHPNPRGEDFENVVFIESIAWFPWYFLFALLALLVFAQRQMRNSDEHKRRG